MYIPRKFSRSACTWGHKGVANLAGSKPCGNYTPTPSRVCQVYFHRTKLHVEAHFDNSPNNKFNPNPNKTVYYGEMTWEEMMFPFFGVVVDKDANPNKILVGGRGALPPGA
jgi:hypothetical protein